MVGNECNVHPFIKGPNVSDTLRKYLLAGLQVNRNTKSVATSLTVGAHVPGNGEYSIR